jgi:primosomal protein N' (replication factor Y)
VSGNMPGSVLLADIVTPANSWDSEQPYLTYEIPAALRETVRPGHLVAIPYGEKLVQGVVWTIREQKDDMQASGQAEIQVEAQVNVGARLTTPDRGGDQARPYVDLAQRGSAPGVAAMVESVVDEATRVRPVHALLDAEPVLLPHQMQLAQWLSEYYVTPLAQTAFMMLPPGLVQRSQSVLHLVQDVQEESIAEAGAVSPRLRALIGLLQAEQTLDVEQLRRMLGPTRAKQVMQEALASGLIARTAQLKEPRTKTRKKCVVRLIATDDVLAAWRERKLAQISHGRAEVVPTTDGEIGGRMNRRMDGGRDGGTASARPRQPAATEHKGRRRGTLDPWGLAPPVVPIQDKEALAAQHQLAAVDLLQQSDRAEGSIQQLLWTPGMLCKASEMTAAQLRQLEREQIITLEEEEVRRDPLAGRAIPASAPLSLTPDQQRVLEAILNAAASRPLLLHGVTGSGKTEVYLQALAAKIAQGQQGIMLVPEIALTPQAVQRVAGRFPGRVAVIHSALSDGERYDEWRRIRSGAVDVVIGSRSALFAPLARLGLIIVDEEHEPAYKQAERRPTYHARGAAVTLGKLLCVPVVLGSATPAIETYYRATQGAYQLLELPGRIGASLPPVEIVDLRDELHAGNTSIISRRLHEELERVLSRGQQAILFLNRRGAASCVLCRDCGFVALCGRCDIPLTYHATERILLCHYCGSISRVPQQCPACTSVGIRYFGLGTEKVQETIHRSFPAARLLRWDRDTARTRHAHEELLERFARREADILVGTQMIAKGLDLPGVTLVGIVSADIALNLPDYAAPERAFTLLTQVAGRAGRGAEAGTVILQTFNPQHFCIGTAAQHDYATFYKVEIETRRRYCYPPFRQFVKFTYSHENRHRAQNEALLLSARLTDWIACLALPDTDVVGPAPALMERMRGRYRWQLIVRGPDLHRLLRVLDTSGWEVDIDPVGIGL